MTAPAPLRRRSRRRAERPSARLVVTSAVLLDLLFLVGAVAAWPIYRSTAFLVTVGVALVVAHALAWAGMRWRWSGWWLALAAFGVYVVLGLPVAAPSMLGSVDQALRGFVRVVTAPATGWKDLLTLDLPVGSYQTVLTTAFLLWIAVPTAALSLAWRARRLWVLAPLLGLGLTAFGVLFGSTEASAAVVVGAVTITAPAETAVGAAGLVLALGYTVWRTVDERRRALRAVEAATGIRTTGRSGSATAGRVAISLGMVVIAVAGAAAAAPFAIAGQPRDVLRARVDPHLEIQRELSPLSQYRSYFTDERYDEVLFAVVSGADRVRLATLPFHDGQLARVLDPTVPGGDQSTAFTRVPSRLPAPAGTRAVSADVTLVDYDEIWMPTVGALTSVQFRSGDTGALADGFFYSVPAQMGVQLAERSAEAPVGYHLEAAVPRRVPALESLTPGRSSPAFDSRVVPESLTEWIRAQGAPTGGEGLAVLIERLRARGYLSHALTIDPDDPPRWRAELGQAAFEPSRAGHSTDRIDALFTALLERQNEIGDTEDDERLVAAVGDDEQFAVAGAMIADQLGFETRIVVGARLASDDLPACEAGVCRGGDLAAWIEVRDVAGVWVPVDVTPQHEVGMSPDNEQNRDPEVPTQVRRDEAEQVLPGEADPAERGARDDDPLDTGADLGALWAVLRATGLSLAILLAVTGPFLLVVLVKALRRRARRRADDTVARVTGGWDEYLDTAIDVGLTAPRTHTRQEVASLHRESDPTSRATLLATWADRSVFDQGRPSDADTARFWEIVEAERARLLGQRGWWPRLRARLSLRSLVRRPR